MTSDDPRTQTIQPLIDTLQEQHDDAVEKVREARDDPEEWKRRYGEMREIGDTLLYAMTMAEALDSEPQEEA